MDAGFDLPPSRTDTMSRSTKQLAPDPSMRQRPPGIDPHDFVGSLFDSPPDSDSDTLPSFSASSAHSALKSKSDRHRESLSHIRTISGADRGPSTPGLRTGRDIAIADLRERLFEYIRGVGVGCTFQSVDFLNWLDAHQLRPLELDMRVLGGMFNHLLRVPLIEKVGHAPNGGGAHHNSAERPVYRILRLDASRTGWFSPPTSAPHPS